MRAAARSETPFMPTKSCLDHLVEIRNNASRARQWTVFETSETIQDNRLAMHAVMRSLENIAEASRSLPQDVRDRHPHLYWREIMDTANVYQYPYENVSRNAVWRIVRQTLPLLLEVADCEIAALSPH